MQGVHMYITIMIMHSTMACLFQYYNECYGYDICHHSIMIVNLLQWNLIKDTSLIS